MFFFLVHLVVRRLLRVLAGSSAVAALEVENAVLRHQLVVLRRTVKAAAAAAEGSGVAGRGERAAAAGALAGAGFAADVASLAP